jgi:hypothetical protein
MAAYRRTCPKLKIRVGHMTEDLAKVYVDRLLREGFAIDIIGENTIVIVDPVNVGELFGARDTGREANPSVHKDAIISYLRKLHRIV